MDLQTVIDAARGRFADLRQRAVAALEQLSDDDINWRPNEASNSLAVLVVHMRGNLSERIISGIGGSPYHRDRDAEFNYSRRMTREEAVAILGAALDEVDAVLAGATPQHLQKAIMVRGRPQSGLEVLLNTATHIAEHVGQILYIAKLRLGDDYRVLSVPHKKS